MSEVEIQVGDWVCLKWPGNKEGNVPMVVKHITYQDAVVMWFLDDRSLVEKSIPIKLLEIIDWTEEYWAP